MSGGLDTTVSQVLAIPSKRNVRANSSDKAIKDYNELAKKKYESTLEMRGMATIVQNSMVTKNREQAQLAMTMKLDIYYRQIDTAEDRPGFDAEKPPQRWTFATDCVARLINEYKLLEELIQNHPQTFFSPIEK